MKPTQEGPPSGAGTGAWLARMLTGVLIVVLAVLALAPAGAIQPALNRLLRFFRLPYEVILWIEGNIGLFTHCIGVFLLAFLLNRCRLRFPAGRAQVATSLLGLMILLEVVHYALGRGFSVVDVLVGGAALLAAVPFLEAKRAPP